MSISIGVFYKKATHENFEYMKGNSGYRSSNTVETGIEDVNHSTTWANKRGLFEESSGIPTISPALVAQIQ
jgi:hypothetical protein